MTQETAVEISDEVVEVAARALARKFDPASALDEQMNCDHWKRFKDEARTAIQAALPLLVEGLVELERLRAIINTPQSDDFLRAVSIEAEHQRQRWGSDHDSGKTAADWFWLVGYLGGKALHAHAAGNTEKAEHHVITTAAACANWHMAMLGKTDMRPGIDAEQLIAAHDGKGNG